MSSAAERSPPPLRHAARRPAGFSNRELSTIAVLASLHFAVSFAARLLGGVLYVFLGPWSVYVDGIASEAIPCLITATTVVLVPRVGTAGLSILTVWLLNAVVTGTFTATSLVQVSVSVVVHEAILFALRATHLRRVDVAATTVERFFTSLTTALGVGAANAGALYIQFYISMQYFKLHFDAWYIHSVALLTGFVYGGVGAAIGARWALDLRRTAP